MRASYYGDDEIVSLLLENDADISLLSVVRIFLATILIIIILIILF